MRIPISVAILGAVVLIGAVGVGVLKLRDVNWSASGATSARPAPGQEMAMAREMIGQWRPPGLTCTDAVTITFHSGNLTVNYASQSEDDVQAVAGLEPNGFIRTYSATLGSRFYIVEGDTLIVHSGDGKTTELERCEGEQAVAPVVAPAAAPTPIAAPAPPPQQASGDRTVAEATQSPAPRPPAPPPARSTTTVADNAAPDETPPPELTLLAATPAAPTPEPASAPVLPPIARPVWLARPTAADVAIFYPERALVRELPGSARLDCVVRDDGSLTCSVQSESPAGYGFGEAALGIAQSFRMAPRLDDGSATEGRHVSVPLVFTQN